MSKTQTMLAESLRVLGPLLVVAVGVGAFLVFGKRPEAAPREIRDDNAAAVESALIEQSDGQFTIEVDGVSLSYRRVTHAAEVAGRVTKKVRDCRSGHYVEEGEFLLEIDPTNYTLEAERLAIQIERADQNLAEVDVDLENAASLIELAKEDLKIEQENLARVQRLMSSKATTDTQLDTARMQELASRNTLQTFQNQLSALRQRKNTLQAAKKLAQTELKQAEVDVARTKISAPLTGTLVTVDVEEGDYVKAGDPLFQINDTETMEVSCQLRVDELYWVWLQAGTFGARSQPEVVSANREAVFEIPSIPVEVAYPFRNVEYLWQGVLSRYDGTGLDPDTRTIPCRVRVDAPTEVRVSGSGAEQAIAPPTLFSGMYVKVRIPIDTSVPMLHVPLAAVRPQGRVWVVRDGKLAILPVDVARKQGETALIRIQPGGPQAGERVITSPLAAVEEGMEVKDISLKNDPPPDDEPVNTVANGTSEPIVDSQDGIESKSLSAEEKP